MYLVYFISGGDCTVVNTYYNYLIIHSIDFNLKSFRSMHPFRSKSRINIINYKSSFCIFWLAQIGLDDLKLLQYSLFTLKKHIQSNTFEL